MNPVTIDSGLRAHLNGLTDQMEFRDEEGRLLGHFVPAIKRPVELLPADRCPYSNEELERMRNETGGKPLSEIWEKLGGR